MSYRAQNINLPPIDKDVAVPAAIRAAALKADALHKEAYNTPDTPQDGTEPQGTPPAAEATQTPPDPRTPATGQPQAKDGAKDDFQQKYKSLKPRYDKQEETISQLNGRINALEAQLNKAAKPPAERRNPDLSFKPIAAEERDAYGDDFLDVAARAAREKLDPEIRSLRAELDDLKGQLGDVSEKEMKRDQDQIRAFLTSQLPSWRQINKDPRFIAWCNLPDPFSNGIRMAMLQDAFARGDAHRVLRFFNGFLTDEAATTPAGNRPETPRPNGNGKVPLENFAAPGRATAPAGYEPPGEKEIITTAQIAAFYTAVQKGHYRGNEAEKDRLEREIFAAQADGRVQ